ncbi:MAG: pyruvate kinase [Planctomycetes bacterium]|nr:pyruvate kinase [Planctomycetota bacterium]
MQGPTPEPQFSSVADEQRCGTKIVATIGPASEDRVIQLIDAGMAVARINFSHGVDDDHRRRVEKIRTAARLRGVPIGILADIQGPKMRLGKLAGGELRLARGQVVRLFEGALSDELDLLPCNFLGFRGALKVGDRVLLADGVVELVTEAIDGDIVRARVRRPGPISDRKGVHMPDSYLAQELPTPQDRKHISLAQELGVDFLGVSFVSRGEDMERIRDLAPKMMLVAKIERRTALDNLKGIFEASDGIMVARGDLGVETQLEQLPLLQKTLIQEALKAGKFVITATEMLESMIKASRPTRAEVTDVANAVLDGSDAVMLSAETAMGDYPIEAVQAMSRIARAVETSQRYHELPRVSFRQNEPTFSNATALAAAQAAEALSIHRIICFTESGNTVRLLSRYRVNGEIIALTPNEKTLQEMTILSHVRPILCERETSLEDMMHEAQNLLLEQRVCLHGEEVIFVAGVPPGVSRSTNVMKLHRIGEPARMH